jgi:hypothetical protein
MVPGFGLGPGSTDVSNSQARAPARILEVYARSPVLVRAGEHVRLPVDVVCATVQGDPCDATVTLATRSGGKGAWQMTTAEAVPGLRFDVSAPAARAAATGSTGAVEFFVRATGPGGRTSVLPAAGAASPLRFVVAKDIPVARAPIIPFGRVQAGHTALALPWGSGPRRAGLAAGLDSATLGPSSFDVDARGRIYLADSLQDRLAVFAGGKLVRETPLPISARADIALTDRGAVFVLDQEASGPLVRRMDPNGRLGPGQHVGSGILGQVRTVGETGLTALFPQDVWSTVSATDQGALSATGSTSGRPATGGREFLRVVAGDSVRLATVAGGRVADAIEVRFGQRLGELALAEPDGVNGYWAVVHVRREQPPADHYQVLHVSSGRVVQSFAVGDRRFADTPPLSRFRLGRDGLLYQLVTSPEGIRILRYGLGRES